LLCLTSLAGTSAQSGCPAKPSFHSSVPYSANNRDSLNFSAHLYIYKGAYDNIRGIDFRNFPLYVDGGIVRLKDGRHKEVDRLGKKFIFYDEVGLEKADYLTAANVAGPQYALIFLHDWSAGGSSSQSTIAQVLELRDRKLRLIQQFQTDDHFGGPWKRSFDADTGTLVMNTAHYKPGDAHCCVSAYDLYKFKWDGRCFIQTSISTEPSDRQ